jgi:phage shock protein PspC (stress-responsive transcriptional regulator)
MERSLRRPLDDRIIGGVCGGVGRYFDVDPTVVRLLWVLFAILAGAGVPLYLLAWWVIPDDQGQRSGVALALVLLFLVVPFVCCLCTWPGMLLTGTFPLFSG